MEKRPPAIIGVLKKKGEWVLYTFYFYLHDNSVNNIWVYAKIYNGGRHTHHWRSYQILFLQSQQMTRILLLQLHDISTLRYPSFS